MDSKFKTIGSNDPLDSVIPDLRAKKAKQQQEEYQAQAVEKERLTVYLTKELVEKVKNIVYWTPGLTLGAFAHEALEREVAKREQKNGGTFAPRQSRLKAGRPMK